VTSVEGLKSRATSFGIDISGRLGSWLVCRFRLKVSFLIPKRKGDYWNGLRTLVRPSDYLSVSLDVCPSVRLSVRPYVRTMFVSASYIEEEERLLFYTYIYTFIYKNSVNLKFRKSESHEGQVVKGNVLPLIHK